MEIEMTVEEIERQIRKLKRKRHREGTECRMKHGYGTEGIVERLVEVMNGVWRGERFPVD
jgi:hypothetical protein